MGADSAAASGALAGALAGAGISGLASGAPATAAEPSCAPTAGPASRVRGTTASGSSTSATRDASTGRSLVNCGTPTSHVSKAMAMAAPQMTPSILVIVKPR
jgi:hypothetical protein